MRKALKAAFYACAAVLVVMFFLSLLGIIDNNRGNAFGFIYKTDYVSFLLTMAMIAIALTDGWFTWLGELGLICLDAYMLWLHGKTGFASLFVLTFAVMWRHYRREGGVPYQDKKKYGVISYVFRVIYLPVIAADKCAGALKLNRIKPAMRRVMVFSFPICFAVNCLLVFTYPALKSFWESVPLLRTFKDRMIYGLLGFQEYPVRLFGNGMPSTYMDRSERVDSLYFTLDSSYLRFLLDYGLILFILFFGVFTLLMMWFYRKNYNLGLLIMSIIAVDAIVENQFINWLLVSVFLIMALLYPVKDAEGNCDRLNFERLTPRKRLIAGIVFMLLFTVSALWCFTAYSITNWRGMTPEYGATIVVPGDYLSSGNDLVDAAGDYLLTHPDAVCIVSSDSGRSRLIELGVDEGRIYITNSYSVDGLLESSRVLIESERLPNRLTVCAYSMQQERISRHAAKLHIPVNAIPVRPESGYLFLFAGEQWRLLCGM